jgi:two-component system chemotaxis response regulator CheY
MQRVLVVDDSSLMHTLMKHTLARRRDFEIGFAKNGKEALDIVAASGAPSLVLLDINMPVMNGLEFLDQLAVLGVKERVKVIIVSTEGSEQDVLRGLEAGARGYLRKPFKANELHDLIDRVLA